MIITFHTALPTDGTGAPDWVQLVPAGTFRGADGRGPYRLANPAAVIQASAAADGVRLAIDENHSTDLAAPRGEPAPARGWIVELQARPDGIWGRVEWTESGRALMADRSYRGISPVFETDKSGTVLRLLRAALTNNPNLPQLATLHQQGHTMDLAIMRSHLGLPADADEAAITAAVAAHATRLTEMQAQLAAAVKPDAVVALQTQLATVTAQLNAVQAESKRAKAVALVDKAIGEGRVGVVALRDHYITRHMADPASVELELGKLPCLNAGGLGNVIVERHDMADGDMLTETESKLCAATNTDPKKMAKWRKAGRPMAKVD